MPAEPERKCILSRIGNIDIRKSVICNIATVMFHRTFAENPLIMESEEDIVREDQLKHPNCHYSISLSRSCGDKDGSFVCETVKNITRLCPNSRPVSVYSKRSKSDSSADDELNGSGFPGFPGQSSGQFPDLADILRQLQRAQRPAAPQPPASAPSIPDQDDNHGQDEYENGFKNLLKSFGFRSGGGKPNGPGGSTGNAGGANPGCGPQLPPGRTSGPSEDI